MRERNKAIARMYLEGATMQEVGDHFLISRQRVKQILDKFGIPGRSKNWRSNAHYKRVFNAVGYVARRSMTYDHGTRYAYDGGCSCEDCRAANRAYMAGLKKKDPPNHGLSGYTNYGCRCPICTAANTQYSRDHPEYRENWLRRKKEREALERKG